MNASAEQDHSYPEDQWFPGADRFALFFPCHAAEKQPQLEETPKWQALKQVLDEIDGEIQQMVASGDLKNADDCRVLVCAEDDHTCHHLREVSRALITGAASYSGSAEEK